MPHVKPSTIRDMTPDEIESRLGELREEMFNLRFRNSMKQLDNPLKIRESRREIARLLTIQKQKQAAAGQGAGTVRATAKRDADRKDA